MINKILWETLYCLGWALWVGGIVIMGMSFSILFNWDLSFQESAVGFLGFLLTGAFICGVGRLVIEEVRGVRR